MQVPWEDLCYLFGEIMYGGHITNIWDRRLCKSYLQEFMHPKMVSPFASILCTFNICVTSCFLGIYVLQYVRMLLSFFLWFFFYIFHQDKRVPSCDAKLQCDVLAHAVVSAVSHPTEEVFDQYCVYS